MEVEIKKAEKRVYIWLTKADAENVQLRESLKPFYQKCKAKGFLCAVFISGTGDLRESIRDLLIYNKYRLDEIEYRKTHKDEHFFSPWWELYQDHLLRAEMLDPAIRKRESQTIV